MAASPWHFYPPERQKGRVFYSFFNANDKDYPDVKPILAILLGKLQGTLLAMVPSPCNTPYEVLVCDIKVGIIEDNWPCPYLSATESDAPVLERIVNRLIRELGASVIGVTS